MTMEKRKVYGNIGIQMVNSRQEDDTSVGGKKVPGKNGVKMVNSREWWAMGQESD